MTPVERLFASWRDSVGSPEEIFAEDWHLEGQVPTEDPELFLWLWHHQQRTRVAPWRDLRVLASVSDAERSALVFEGMDPVTELRQRAAWFAQSRGQRIVCLKEVRAFCGPQNGWSGTAAATVQTEAAIDRLVKAWSGDSGAANPLAADLRFDATASGAAHLAHRLSASSARQGVPKVITSFAENTRGVIIFEIVEPNESLYRIGWLVEVIDGPIVAITEVNERRELQ